MKLFKRRVEVSAFGAPEEEKVRGKVLSLGGEEDSSLGGEEDSSLGGEEETQSQKSCVKGNNTSESSAPFWADPKNRRMLRHLRDLGKRQRAMKVTSVKKHGIEIALSSTAANRSGGSELARIARAKGEGFINRTLRHQNERVSAIVLSRQKPFRRR